MLCYSRIPESLPCLHDKVLAAAADAALSFSLNQKKKQVQRIASDFGRFYSEDYWYSSHSFSVVLQGNQPGILAGIVKGLKGGKMVHAEDFSMSPKSNFRHLEGMFLKSPFSDPSPAVTDNQEEEELNIGSDLYTYLYTLFLFVVFFWLVLSVESFFCCTFLLNVFSTSCFWYRWHRNRWTTTHGIYFIRWF